MSWQIPKFYKVIINVLVIVFHIITCEYYRTSPSIVNFKGMFEFFSKSCETLKLKDSFFLCIYCTYLCMVGYWREDRFTKILPLPLRYCNEIWPIFKFWWLKTLMEQLGWDQSQEKTNITKRYAKRFFCFCLLSECC